MLRPQRLLPPTFICDRNAEPLLVAFCCATNPCPDVTRLAFIVPEDRRRRDVPAMNLRCTGHQRARRDARRRTCPR